MINGTDSQVKKEIDLSKINTVTHTFVRSSALDILAQFPKTETVSAMEGGEKCTTLKAVKEDAQEGRDECTDSGTTCSRSADHLSSSSQPRQIEVSSWSSTGDIKKKQKKKGLFQNNKKVKGVSNPPEDKSTDQTSDQDKPKKEKKKLRKQKAKSSQAWSSFFRGKSVATDEETKDIKSKKQKKKLKKSQSFDSNSLPRSSQLNRMNSIRKLFKRPRDSASATETEPINNVKCVEISNPILKTDFRSKNLVDREVFLRDRAYQIDKAKAKQEKTENECGVVISNVKTKNDAGEKDMSLDSYNNENSKSKHDTVIVNGFVESPQNPNSEESPKAPIRFKHLERKRLSMPGLEGLSQEDITEHQNNENSHGDKENLTKNSNDVKKDEKLEVQINNSDNRSTSDCSTEINDLNKVNKTHDSINESEIQDYIVNMDQNIVAGSPINSEPLTIRQDNDENLNYIFVESVSSNLVTSDIIPTQMGSTLSSPQSHESEFEEVFVDCVSDETISLDSATPPVDKPKVLATHRSDETDGRRMPAGRWNSSVTSRDSKDAIAKTMKKKAASFSGGEYIWNIISYQCCVMTDVT